MVVVLFMDIDFYRRTKFLAAEILSKYICIDSVIRYFGGIGTGRFCSFYVLFNSCFFYSVDYYSLLVTSEYTIVRLLKPTRHPRKRVYKQLSLSGTREQRETQLECSGASDLFLSCRIKSCQSWIIFVPVNFMLQLWIHV